MLDINKFQYLGAIVRIRIRNFMTYDDVELFPGPNLNIILGPNGTGKSAIVCCIIVGLAGDVSLTGRGSSPAAFVKKSRDSGSTEIELFNDNGKNFIIQRVITITARNRYKIDHISDWKINGKAVKKADIKALTHKLNIRVDNLCQFLPQDKVAEFVKMDHSDLLMNTLKAAGDNQLVEDHQKLSSYTRVVEEKRSSLESLERARKQNEVNAKRLESDVIQLRQRDNYMKKKQLCVQKMSYLQYHDSLAQREMYKETRNRMIEDRRRVELSSEPRKEEIKERSSKEEKVKSSLRRIVSMIPQAIDSIEGKQEKCAGVKQKVQEKFAELKKKLEEEKHRANSISMKKQEISSLECKLEELKDLDLSKQLEALKREMDACREARKKNLQDKRGNENNLQEAILKLDQFEKEIDQIRRVQSRKIQDLQHKNKDAFLGFEWLNKNRDRFKKQVFSPMILEIDVKDPSYACLVENSIPTHELMSFVCQTKEDLQTLTRAARDELKIKLSVVLAPTKTMEHFDNENKFSPSYLKSIQVKAFLRDLINAPEPVMRYLCANQNFHRIPIADEGDSKQFKVFSEKFRKFYIGKQFYHVAVSKYDGQQVTGSERVREARLLIHSLDTVQLKQKESQYNDVLTRKEGIQRKLEEVAKENDDLMNEWNKLAAKNSEFQKKEDEKKCNENYLKKCHEALARYMAEKIDTENERTQLSKSIEALNDSSISSLGELMESYRIFNDTRRIHKKNVFKVKMAVRNHRVSKKKLSKALKDCARLTDEIRRAELNLKTFTAAMNSLKKAAEDKITGFREGKLDRGTQEKFAKIEENTISQLKDRIDDLAVRISKIFHDANNTILNEYNRQNEELRDRTEQIAELTTELKTLETTMQEIKRTWVPRLQEVIEAIDKNYRIFMQKLSYDGQVKLFFDEKNPDNFSVYGISILVRYRDNDNLIPLSSTRQSGGERSVATMIYMLALQAKTTVPFRCVDEINQGMDKQNERKVFELLIHTADSSSSQYFLVSPKLLHDLPYSDKMQVHVVCNGRQLHSKPWTYK